MRDPGNELTTQSVIANDIQKPIKSENLSVVTCHWNYVKVQGFTTKGSFYTRLLYNHILAYSHSSQLNASHSIFLRLSKKNTRPCCFTQSLAFTIDYPFKNDILIRIDEITN